MGKIGGWFSEVQDFSETTSASNMHPCASKEKCPPGSKTQRAIGRSWSTFATRVGRHVETPPVCERHAVGTVRPWWRDRGTGGKGGQLQEPMQGMKGKRKSWLEDQKWLEQLLEYSPFGILSCQLLKCQLFSTPSGQWCRV